jgi:uncharacterized membrane protein YdjX (TVP38/TMEM64 family)
VSAPRHEAEDLIAPRGRGIALRAAAGAAVLAAVLVLARALSVESHAGGWLDAARGAGPAGVLLHAALYVLAALLGLPVSPLTVAAGAAYGPLLGAALGAPAATAGACCAFLVGRPVARDPDALARGDGRVARAARAIGRGGVRLVVLLRVAPVVPFSILNFAFGATPTRLSAFALGSLLGSTPSQLGYALLGTVLAWPLGPARTRAELALVAGAALLTLIGTAGAIRVLRRRGSPDGGAGTTAGDDPRPHGR